MRIHTVTISLLLVGKLLTAQDPHFSQFFASPLTLNPAGTGNFDGIVRVAGNYRNQWPGMGNAFTTATLSIDGHLPFKKLPAHDQVSAGLLLLTDQSGGGLLKQNYFGLSLAYTKSLTSSGDHRLTAGVQGVYGEFRFDPSLANFEDELSPAGFTLPSSDWVLSATPVQRYADLHAGVLYQGSFSDNNLFYLGASIYHVNKPRLSFSTPESYINRRYNLQGGYYQPLGDYFRLHTSAQYQQQYKSSEWVYGGAVSYVVDERDTRYFELFAGMWMRHKDALIPYVGMDWKNIRAGFTYDVILPGQRLAAARYQSMEFSLMWFWDDRASKGRIRCPKF